jgi:hypothetical protein
MAPLSLTKEALDLLSRHATAYRSFQDLLDAEHDYFPTLDMRDPDAALLADFYDQAQEERGDPRRAFRTPAQYRQMV